MALLYRYIYTLKFSVGDISQNKAATFFPELHLFIH